MAVLIGGRDNVVSISVAESIKLLALSVIWGSWIVVKHAAVRAVTPLWSNGGGQGDDVHGVDRKSGVKAADDDTVATTSGKKAARRSPRDRPPPCLFTTVYGTHSYVKVKVPCYCNII